MYAYSKWPALLTVLVVLFAHRTPVLGDIVLYKVPRTSLVVQLQGKTTVNPGRTVSYRHPKFGRLTLDLDDVTYFKLPTTNALFMRKLNKAKTADEAMAAAQFALKQGLLKQVYLAVDKALQFDSDHPRAKLIRSLKKRMDKPLADTGKEERYLREHIRYGRMKLKKSKHFILLHDTPDKAAPFHSLPRADERLQLLETVYESFLLKFYSQGVALELPQERLMVVLFNEHEDYLDFATALSPGLSSAAGFWDGNTNIAVFYDQGTDESFEPLLELAKDVNRQKAQSLANKDRKTKDIVRMADAITLLVEISKENMDIEVVSHEATHQMAGNTGLFPRRVMAPDWVHEGLATYFESPNDATWSGIGAVNTRRLERYHELAADREHSDIDFIISDKIFDLARTNGAAIHGYGQAWALTHFLMERHFQKLMTYYRRLGEMPADLALSPKALTQLFDEVFGTNRRSLDSQWRVYMKSLKTDLARIVTEARSK